MSVPRSLTDAEAAALLKRGWSRRGVSGRRDRLMLALMLRLGLRQVEVRRLQLADWDAVAGTLRVEGKRDRSGKDRIRLAYVDGETREALERWLVLRPVHAVEPWLLCTVREGIGGRPVGSQLTRAMVCERVPQCAERAGITRRVTAHMLRHTFGTQTYRESGGDIRLTQELIGHASITSTMIYTHVSEEDKAAFMRNR